MERFYKCVESDYTSQYNRQSRMSLLIGFVSGCLITGSIIIIIAYITSHTDKDYNKINPFEPLDRPIYVSWDSLDLPIINDNTSSVCFDYDDTIAFTTQAFEFAKNMSGGSVDRMWDIVNNEHVGERLSLNKNTTLSILRRYVDNVPNSPIRIITSRCSAASELLTNDELNIQRQISKSIPKATNLVVYMSCTKFPKRLAKIHAIRYFGCRVFFGDSDDDIRSCILAGNCSPFRILRAPNSTYKSNNNPGLFHEPIVLNSEY